MVSIQLKYWILLYFSLIIFSACGEKIHREKYYGVVPKPNVMELGQGGFDLSRRTKFCLLDKDTLLRYSIENFNVIIEKSIGEKLDIIVSDKPVNRSINISLDSELEEEAYRLQIRSNRIDIVGGTAKGVFYALQTMQQLVPSSVLEGKQTDRIELPEIKITDKPYFKYRGAMLDVGRYYFEPEEIKQFIDVLAMHKMNVFHWHLTEDYGWRIEIKKYPNLTKVGSIREKSPYRMERGKPIQFDNKPHGGFYTQEEIRDIVKYAAERFITIIPEIELPGHATAALASYPHLGCKGKDYKVETIWRVTDEAFCVGRESTFEFLDNVFTEVVDLFPSEYVHIGGDECRKVRWKECPMCQKRIKDEHLKDEIELQSYFVKRVEKILQSKGKKIIGWDEILEGGVSPTATVMSWRGVEGGIEAAKKGNHVIMAPSSYCYLDFYQSKDMLKEPLSIGGYLPIDSVYSFNPLEGLTAEESNYIEGVQANIWTAFMDTTEIVYYMTLPRLAAVAEVAWSYRKGETLTYSDFKHRMADFRVLYDIRELPYAKYMFEENDSIKIVVSK
ncbi:beta-N-acetylhexosaminidase [Parabacteroides johnsonii]|jgi:N-acetyl-beta-hexosaminidase|uniref:beta-N-acetylhexosaminidase n=1 Tax=Parabacteroides johnsonii TaxID=387661 RepID=UPI00242B226B|nr:beta-N-acetylhexosaminidase [Parabacteroides johnsonii]